MPIQNNKDIQKEVPWYGDSYKPDKLGPYYSSPQLEKSSNMSLFGGSSEVPESSGVGLFGKYSLTQQKEPTGIGVKSGGLQDPYTGNVNTEPYGKAPLDTKPAIEGMDSAADVDEKITSANDSSSFGDTIGDIAGSVGSSLLNNILSTLKQDALNDYQKKAQYWENQKKTWFDPNYDSVPSLAEYLKDQPDPTDVLTESTLTGGEAPDAAVLIGSSGISAAFDDQDQAEYIWNKGGEGAAEGAMAAGWVGAVVGGVVGVVEGAFTWASAEDDKEEAIRKAKKEYQAKYDNWVKQRKKMARAYQYEFDQMRLQESQMKKQEKQQQAVSRKQSFMNTLAEMSQGVKR